MTKLYILYFVVTIILFFLAVLFVEIANRIKQYKHPIYHKINKDMLSVFVYSVSRSNGGGVYTEHIYKKAADGTYIKYIDKDKKNNNIKIVFCLLILTFVGTFVFLTVKNQVNISSIIFTIVICIYCGLVIWLTEVIEKRKVQKYIKEHFYKVKK